MGYGGEGVSQSPLKDQAFSTFLDQNPPFELPPENGISPSIKSLSRPMDRHRQQCHQATSEGQMAVAPLSLIAVQSRNLMVAHPGSGPAFNFRRRSTSRKSHSAVSQGNVARRKRLAAASSRRLQPDPCDWLNALSRVRKVGVCPLKAKVTRSNRVGCANKINNLFKSPEGSQNRNSPQAHRRN